MACAVAHGHRNLAIMTVATDSYGCGCDSCGVHSSPPHRGTVDYIRHWKHYHSIPAHVLASALGAEKSRGSLFWYAFSGVDTVSSFGGIGKKTAWDVWMAFPGVNAAFSALSTPVEDISDANMALLERFAELLYSKSLDVENVNQAKQTLFAKGTRALENIPLAHAALQQHIKRAVLQAGYIWGQAICVHPTTPIPSSLGLGRKWQWLDPKVDAFARGSQRLLRADTLLMQADLQGSL